MFDSKAVSRFLFLVLVALTSVPAVAATRYPVDDEIDAHMAKAQYLKDFKQLLLDKDCSVTVGKNKVALVASALRSEGLVIGIAEGNAGNYWAYHQAPKPEFLDRVTGYKNSLIVSGRLAYDSFDTSKVTDLGVYIAKPKWIKDADGLYIYDKSFHKLAIPSSASASSTTKGVDGVSVTLECSVK